MTAQKPAFDTVENRLNLGKQTRLPRLKAGDDAVLITARVMEFQFQQGLTPDGMVGPKTLAQLPKAAAGSIAVIAPAGRCILVDLIKGKLTAFKNGVAEIQVSP